MKVFRQIILIFLLPYITLAYFIIGFIEGRFEYLNLKSFWEFFTEELF
jgi:hypothetical protein